MRTGDLLWKQPQDNSEEITGQTKPVISVGTGR